MTITYPLAMPAKPGIKRIRLVARNVVGVSISPFTMQQQTYLHQGERWEAEVTLPPMLRALAEGWLSFLMSLRGPSGTFILGDPDAKTVRGTGAGTPLVNGASQTGLSLITDGWGISQTVLKAGDYIELGSGATRRLYKTLTDTVSDGAGNATLDIWPRLRESPANNAPIAIASCKALFRLASAEAAWETDEISIYGVTFAAVEAI